ncbi:MAG: class II aldolase/adducin family protein [Ignavibacteriales bacterium]|jgi:L-fuculose-phosphate aldolase|nr:class II aldolase/adducin family protein [Ignavibacteriales bacterium]MBK8661324.1 class II aldolase/adducin family protein [Ignavibacteriales bacterium]MBP9121917.1 class II aldolase/adducin family protein [Ignavibacteriaceae bacterium]MCC6638244.1 class II aldolase/adducin family protein [Ignavibacteriaceae bacterium]
MQVAEELIKYSKLVYQKGFLAATDGNLSARLPNGNILITGSSVCKGEIVESDLVETDLDGNIITGNRKPSTESKLHYHIYKNRSDVNAVIHTHPVFALVCASSNISMDKPYFPEVILSIGRIPTCKYATPSTDALHRSLDPFIDYASVFLLQNHGAVATGRSIKEAFYRTDKLEHTARVILEATKSGGIKPLLRYQIDELYAIAGKSYGISLHQKNRY